MRRFFIVTVLLVSTGAAHAQSSGGPSAEETLKFINDQSSQCQKKVQSTSNGVFVVDLSFVSRAKLNDNGSLNLLTDITAVTAGGGTINYTIVDRVEQEAPIAALSNRVVFTSDNNWMMTRCAAGNSSCAATMVSFKYTAAQMALNTAMKEPLFVPIPAGRSSQDRMIFSFCDADMGQRLTKAFSHLITVLGGQNEPF